MPLSIVSIVTLGIVRVSVVLIIAGIMPDTFTIEYGCTIVRTGYPSWYIFHNLFLMLSVTY